MRYRLTLSNDDLLELSERVEIQAEGIIIAKHRHHWQDRNGHLIKRWEVVFQKWRCSLSYCPSKGIAVDKQAKNNVVHLRRFGEADRLTNQALHACP
jgi:hypothetical protein